MFIRRQFFLTEVQSFSLYKFEGSYPKIACMLIQISVKVAKNALQMCNYLQSIFSSLLVSSYMLYQTLIVVVVAEVCHTNLWLIGGGCDMLDHLRCMIGSGDSV
jgi:hypothetical protein